MKLTEVADELERGLTARMPSLLKNLPADAQTEVRACMDDLREQITRRASGEDVSQAVREINATMKSWAYVGNKAVRKALLEAAAHAANLVGQALLTTLQTAVSAAAAGAMSGLAADFLQHRKE